MTDEEFGVVSSNDANRSPSERSPSERSPSERTTSDGAASGESVNGATATDGMRSGEPPGEGGNEEPTGWEFPDREERESDDEENLGRAGWALVGVVVTATVLVPAAIYLFPAAPGEAGIPFLVAMLVLPFVPAVLLGATAVWSMAVGDRS